ncbi:(2Fe-2S)-binding protein [Mesobacillus zeae]|uniref:(2Fe-2S)-binding protein n=1 Tax=Mesobacillus zeae TaxID=1917180 RepID=A0A398B1L5_9BACI|nr:(2Fe-2S)-binding protein [Mesobacillus zeae]RID81696.1 (2Fe-2S)-binding protein [Mesobacillus zeae]
MTRIQSHPVLGNTSERLRVPFYFDENLYEGYESETIAAALLANGVRMLRVHEESGTPRGLYCNIGHCMECRVTVNGESSVRACLTTIENNMKIYSGQQLPNPVKRMVEQE